MTMMSTSRIATSRALHYLQQLCQHFRDSAEITQTDGDTTIIFAAGVGKLATRGDVLRLTSRAVDEERLAAVEFSLGAHLERFAFRESVYVSWTRGSQLTPDEQEKYL